MARLINPGTGDVLDRLSILSLKILHAGYLAGKDVDHFRNERNALLTQIRAGNSFSLWIDEYQQLGAVNAALWYAEDELRALRNRPEERRAQWAGFSDKTFWQEAGECAFKIQSLNDERARLIDTINQKTGTATGMEKLT